MKKTSARLEKNCYLCSPKIAKCDKNESRAVEQKGLLRRRKTVFESNRIW